MKKIFLPTLPFIIISMIALLACGANTQKTNQTLPKTSNATHQKTPEFNPDSAYAYIEKQVSFGPRVPNTEPHKQCAKYLCDELARHKATVYQQDATLIAYDGTKLQAKNIIGTFNEQAKTRILLFAHWDTRPYADYDPNPANHRTPIDGADDGASGVGALLEIARQINNNKLTNIGIDIIFFDAEDYGTPTFSDISLPHTWCLGSQFWAKKPHKPNYTADFGILLDMVGTKNAVFMKEYTSMTFAQQYVDTIWEKARDLGYANYFINAQGGAITDDHEYVIKGRGIPSVNIINFDPQRPKGFGDYWHTIDDKMHNIDRQTLKAVGQTVLETIYTYK